MRQPRPYHLLSLYSLNDTHPEKAKDRRTLIGLAIFLILLGLVGTDELNVRQLEQQAYHHQR